MDSDDDNFIDCHNYNEDNEDNEDNDDNQSSEIDENEEPEIYTIESPKYIEYKKKILGKPLYTKHNISSFVLEGKQVKTFVENIKDYGENLQIVEEHWKNLSRDISSKIKPIIHEEFTIVEYTKFKTDDVRALSSLFDGHHRRNALLDIFSQKSNFESIIRVCLIQSDNPNSSQTNILFRELNTRKPFEVDFTLHDISRLLISRLNDEFYNPITKFTFIKDKSASSISRPSIEKTKINNSIQKRLDELKKRFTPSHI